MQWYHEMNGGWIPVIDDDKHIINQLLSHGQVLSISEVWYQLIIINVQANDFGKYLCQGTNKHGTDGYEILVYGLCSFIYKPFVFCACILNVEILEIGTKKLNWV